MLLMLVLFTFMVRISAFARLVLFLIKSSSTTFRANPTVFSTFFTRLSYFITCTTTFSAMRICTNLHRLAITWHRLAMHRLAMHRRHRLSMRSRHHTWIIPWWHHLPWIRLSWHLLPMHL